MPHHLTLMGQSVPELNSLARPKLRAWPWLLLAAGGVGAVVWLAIRPAAPLETVRPQRREIREAIVTSGVVEGRREVSVGSDAQGTIVELLVSEGQQVRRGQPLATVRAAVAHAEEARALSAVETARAALLQAQTGSLASEVATARARVAQAAAAFRQAQAGVRRAETLVSQADARIDEADAGVLQARAALAQAEARRLLAQREFERTTRLVEQGALPRARLDEAKAAIDVAREQKTSASQSVLATQAAVTGSKAGRRAAQEEIAAAREAVSARRSEVDAAISAVESLTSLPRPVDVSLAAQRLQEALASAKAFQENAKQAHVEAPFDGVVTRIIAERGSTVTPAGVVRLVQTSALRVRIDLDEANLGQVRVGLRVELTHPAYPGEVGTARVSWVASDVEQERGTFGVRVIPDSPPKWIKAGQTVDVNLIVSERAQRLVVPASAVHRTTGHTVVFVVERGSPRERQVILGPAIPDGIPVLRGLTGKEQVVRDALAVSSKEPR